MLSNTMSSTYCSACAYSFAQAGRAYPSCAVKSLSFAGISVLVSVFLIILGLCGKAMLTAGGLLYIIINVPVLILIINIAIIYLSVLKAQEQKRVNL